MFRAVFLPSRLVSLIKLSSVMMVMVLAGCASFTKDSAKIVTESEKALRWQAVQAQLSTIDSWQLSGRLGLRIPGRSGSMSIDWTQGSRTFSLLLDGPFGQSLAQVKGNNRGVIANIAGESEPVSGPNPEYLMMRITGWNLPVSNLRYWVMGLPVPGLQSDVVLDDFGQPKTLQQQGWEISYLSYRLENGVRLPARLKVSRDDIRLSLVISSWKLDSTGN